jgi:hypothetical protein
MLLIKNRFDQIFRIGLTPTAPIAKAHHRLRFWMKMATTKRAKATDTALTMVC